MFEVVCKNSRFSRQIMKLIVKICLILGVWPTGTQNQDPRPLLGLFRCHKSNGNFRIGKRAFVENHIFQGKHYCLDLRETSVT